MAFWVNFLGLIFAGVGALLLVFFSLPSLDVGPDGESLVGWSSKSADTTIVECNKQKYKRHKFWSRCGLWVLFAGFALQVAGELIEHVGQSGL